MRDDKETFALLAALRNRAARERGAGCPPESVWIELAAGVVPQIPGDHLAHAAACEHCGSLLRQTMAEFAEETNSEEEKRRVALISSSPEWQRSMASQLSGRGLRLVEAVETPKGQGWQSGISGAKGLMIAACSAVAAATVAAAVMLTWYRPRAEEPQRLIASAYQEKRTIEMRIEGTGFVPLSQERGDAGGQSRMARPALLKAEAEIAQKLQTSPESRGWLQASGRVSLLEGDPQAAIDVLEKALRLEAGDRSLSIDLASAYLLRGQVAKRPEDFGKAIELLGSVLAADPHNEIAQFNDAIALEQLLLKGNAIRAWESFLRDHGDSQWAQEARSRLEALRQESRLKQQRDSRPLMTVEQVAAAAVACDRDRIQEIDGHIEEYGEAAMTEWLPLYSSSAAPTAGNAPVHEPRVLRAALTEVAGLLAARHQDAWLSDMVGSARASPQVVEAVELLAESRRLSRSSDNERALADATRAASIFDQARVPAGSAMARFEIVFINQLQHSYESCAAMSSLLSASAQSHGYSWVRIQSDIEASICNSLDDAKALETGKRALQGARASRFRILETRAANSVAALYWLTGDQHGAWAAVTDGLREYWGGDLPALRGYNLVVNFDAMAEDLGEWFLASNILSESIPIIASDPDVAMKASLEAHLGQDLLKAGEIEESEKHFLEAQRLFREVPPGSRRDFLGAEAELGLANVQLERGNAQGAASLLEEIRPVFGNGREDELRMWFFQTSGIARLRQGDLGRAAEDLSAALRLAEKGLTGSEDERLKWSRRNGALYRAMVELKLRTNPQEALAYWEWYKGAALRGVRARKNGFPAGQEAANAAQPAAFHPLELGGNTALVSYFLASRGLSVWVWDGTEVRQRWIDVSQPELESKVRRFIEHCSNPNSDLDMVRREGAELYRQILLPIEPWIAGHHRLILEPDGVLSLIPLEALVDSQGNYLGDRFAVAVSPGEEYLADARKWRGVSSRRRARSQLHLPIPGCRCMTVSLTRRFPARFRVLRSFIFPDMLWPASARRDW